jgi:hypothetical protein
MRPCLSAQAMNDDGLAYLDILVISSVLSGVNFFGSSDSRKAFMSFSYANSTKTDPCLSAIYMLRIDID